MAESLPPETIAAVRGELGPLADGIINAVRAASPIYGEVFGSPEGMALRLGVEQAIRAFLDAVERGERDGRGWVVGGVSPETDELWRMLGEAEYQAGRSLEDLRAAFRSGIRAAWRGAAEVAMRAGVSAPATISLAEAIFVYGDELATDVVEGFLRIQSDQAGERERRRRRLAGALLDPAGPDAETVARIAELAHWPLPRALAVVALGGDDPAAVARRLDLDVLSGSDGAGPWLVLPDPDAPGRRAAIDRALEPERAAIGPTVAVGHAHRSLRWARLALQVVPGDGPVRAVDHLSELIVGQDRELAALLVRSRLAALGDLPAGERDRLTETLAAWLAHQRHTPAIAHALHVHPQTVRYRIAKLRQLLGEAMDTGEGRFELDLALRAAATPAPSR
ncbi:MAG TPA: helix-turn-helix domain-containing protein [Solirubrobacteraceae bacterium]|nr:helix-turn-helix domain-containing protein [Solirubrobacteraceae bacterium]